MEPHQKQRLSFSLRLLLCLFFVISWESVAQDPDTHQPRKQRFDDERNGDLHTRIRDLHKREVDLRSENDHEGAARIHAELSELLRLEKKHFQDNKDIDEQVFRAPFDEDKIEDEDFERTERKHYEAYLAEKERRRSVQRNGRSKHSEEERLRGRVRERQRFEEDELEFKRGRRDFDRPLYDRPDRNYMRDKKHEKYRQAVDRKVENLMKKLDSKKFPPEQYDQFLEEINQLREAEKSSINDLLSLDLNHDEFRNLGHEERKERLQEWRDKRKSQRDIHRQKRQGAAKKYSELLSRLNSVEEL